MAVNDSEDEKGNGSNNLNASFFALGSAFWTDVLPNTEHVDLLRRSDFDASTLGPISRWGPALRFYTSMILADSRAACLYWGPDRVAVYNEKAAVLFGGAHPKLMGQAFRDGFPELADAIFPEFERASATGTTVDVENIQLFPMRFGYVEETYFIGQFIPLRGDSGEIEGFYNTILETTTQVLHERRRKVVEAVATIPPCSVEEYLSASVAALSGNPYDIPMALLYALDELTESDTDKVRLCGRVGVPEGHHCAPDQANLAIDNAGVIPLFRQVKDNGAPLVLRSSDGSLQATGDLFDGVIWGGYGEPSKDIAILPLSSGGRVLGFYVQGINPRRAYDHVTEMSIVDLVRQMEAKWVMSISTEEAQKREKMLERRLTESERRLRHMAQSAPLGMCQVTPDRGGLIEWANDQFYEITGHVRTKPAIADFLETIAPEDRDKAARDLTTLFDSETGRVVSELRLTRKWSPPVEEDGDAIDNTAWILTVGFPTFENGKLKLVMGYLYDISHQKWAESVQSRNAAAATLAKRRQEQFIDVTFHEVRNPLTAIVQLADGISKCLCDMEDATEEAYKTVALNNVESASTILTCAAHLQRVIDDVLMLSRLESQMLSITPVVARPADVVAKTVKMFDGEVASQGATIEVSKDVSIDTFGAGHVLCDTSRLAQVLINLIGNAIKFTALRAERRVSVVYGAQQRRPPSIRTIFGDLKWMHHEPRPNTILPELQDGEAPLYLYFCIQDTGPGVTSVERDRLFQRFSQANSKTHIAYGGSGLGLYICRELAEKQGGGVGVASTPGKGSVFAFYIETRRKAMTENEQGTTSRAKAHLAKAPSDRPDLPQRLTSRSKVSTPSSELDNPPPPPERRTQLQTNRREGFNVLIVEDNLLNQKILAKQLKTAKCNVTVANHGGQCIEMLKQSDCWRITAHRESHLAVNGSIPIDVILMDWEMPVMNGLDCAKRIRELERDGDLVRRLPIIAITANVRDEQQKQAVAAGMDNVMTKPFTVSDLLTRIHDTINVQPSDSS